MGPPPLLALVAIALALGCAHRVAAQSVQLIVDCSVAATKALPHFWESTGYTPAELALRADGAENTAWIGSVPHRGIGQVRVHFLLDLVVISGYVGNDGATVELLYDWSMLDYVLDTMVANELSPGFELMGSPLAFPLVPDSFFTVSNWNMRLEPADTLRLWRMLVGAALTRYIGRYGAAEVQTWNFESWNEPECGWSWPTGSGVTNASLTGYINYWDASAAAIDDVETALGVSLKFGGPAICGAPRNNVYLDLVLGHQTNAFNGKPQRLDFISVHGKGKNTSYLVAEVEQATNDWVVEAYPAIAARRVPLYNDESDPLVGWATLQTWRADARYGAILPKVVLQHLLMLSDNATTPLPVGLISFDSGMMNLDGYNGWEQRTQLARFTNFTGDGPTGGPWAFVRKQANAVMSGLSLLGDVRCTTTGAATPDSVARANIGALFSVRAASGSEPAQAALVVYNSNDAGLDGTAQREVSVSASSLPFAPGEIVLGSLWCVDNAHSNPYSIWKAQGSPNVPSSTDLIALWRAAGLQPCGDPYNGPALFSVTIPPLGPANFSLGAALTFPGVVFAHLVSKPANPPTAPTGLRAYSKPASSSLLDAGVYTEVLVRWDCDGGARTGAGGVRASAAPTRALGRWEVSVSYEGAAGPWAAVNGNVSDIACVFIHAAPAPGQPELPWYRVTAVDYWGRLGGASDAAQAGPWPAKW